MAVSLAITAAESGRRVYYGTLASLVESLEQASTVLTSNKGFEEWGAVLGDDVMAAALIDRLLHHCHIVNICRNSFRMKAHQGLWRSMQRAAGEATPPAGTGTWRLLHSLRWPSEGAERPEPATSTPIATNGESPPNPQRFPPNVCNFR